MKPDNWQLEPGRVAILPNDVRTAIKGGHWPTGAMSRQFSQTAVAKSRCTSIASCHDGRKTNQLKLLLALAWVLTSALPE